MKTLIDPCPVQGTCANVTTGCWGECALQAAKRRDQDFPALVDRFLSWPLPASVCSDLCVTDRNYPHQRIGTNLLTADEARQMLEYVLAPPTEKARMAESHAQQNEYAGEQFETTVQRMLPYWNGGVKMLRGFVTLIHKQAHAADPVSPAPDKALPEPTFIQHMREYGDPLISIEDCNAIIDYIDALLQRAEEMWDCYKLLHYSEQKWKQRAEQAESLLNAERQKAANWEADARNYKACWDKACEDITAERQKNEGNTIPENPMRALEHGLSPQENDTKLLAAYTPEHYSGHYPPYINLTMVRLQGDVILTVRLPTMAGAPAGATSSVRFTRELWREFVAQVDIANKVWDACDELDSML